MAYLVFDARNVQPATSMEPVPDAWYKVMCRKSNIKPTKDNTGGYLELILEIIEGQYTGRLLYLNLNIFNASQAAVEIAYKQLSAVCHCVGQFQVTSQDGVPDMAVPMLHNIPFMVHAVVAQSNQGPMNNIRGFKDANGNDPGKPGSGVQQPAPTGQPQWGAPQQQTQGVQTAPGGWSPNAPPQPQPQPQPQQGPSWAPQGQGAPGPAPGFAPPPAQQAPPGGVPSWQGGAPTQAPAPQPQGQPGGWRPGPNPGTPGTGQAAPWNR